MDLDRDAIRSSAVLDIEAESERLGLTRRWTEADPNASKRMFLEQAPQDGDIWIFGYGSSTWSPAIHDAERRPGNCREFSTNTVSCLEEFGFRDSNMHILLRRVYDDDAANGQGGMKSDEEEF